MLLVTKIVFVGLNVGGSIPSKYMHFVELRTLDINLSSHLTKMFNTYIFIYLFINETHGRKYVPMFCL